MMSPENKISFTAISGVIGAGKSEVTRLMAREFSFYPLFEETRNNPFLDRFYENPRRYAFGSQISCLTVKNEKIRLAQKILSQNISTVLDVPVQQDAFSYARAQHELKNMTDAEYEEYKKLYRTYRENMIDPDLIICLQASIPAIMQRIGKRDRACEREVPQSYLELLDRYNREWWEKNEDHIPMLHIETDGLDIVQSRQAQLHLLDRVSLALGELRAK